MKSVHVAWWGLLKCYWLVTIMWHCFSTTCTYSWIPYTPTSMSYSSRVMHHWTESKLPRIDLRSLLETNNKWTQLSIYGIWWACLIAAQDPSSTNISELSTLIQTTWFNISLEIFQPLVKWMPCQVTALHQVSGGGGHTWYSKPVL